MVKDVQVLGGRDNVLSQFDLLGSVITEEEVSQLLQHHHDVEGGDGFQTLVVSSDVARHLNGDQRCKQDDLEA